MIPPPDLWWHESHDWHDHEQHLAHHDLAICVPAYSYLQMEASRPNIRQVSEALDIAWERSGGDRKKLATHLWDVLNGPLS